MLLSPAGNEIARYAPAPLKSDKAQEVMFAGIKRPVLGWTKGRYEAVLTVRNASRTELEDKFSFSLD